MGLYTSALQRLACLPPFRRAARLPPGSGTECTNYFWSRTCDRISFHVAANTALPVPTWSTRSTATSAAGSGLAYMPGGMRSACAVAAEAAPGARFRHPRRSTLRCLATARVPLTCLADRDPLGRRRARLRLPAMAEGRENARRTAGQYTAEILAQPMGPCQPPTACFLRPIIPGRRGLRGRGSETENLLAFLATGRSSPGHTLLCQRRTCGLLVRPPRPRSTPFPHHGRGWSGRRGLASARRVTMILVNNVVVHRCRTAPSTSCRAPTTNDGLRFWLGPRHSYELAGRPGRGGRVREDAWRPLPALLTPHQHRWPPCVPGSAPLRAAAGQAYRPYRQG